MPGAAVQTISTQQRTVLRAAFDPRFYYPCKACRGTGKTGEQAESCQKCSGLGHLPK